MVGHEHGRPDPTGKDYDVILERCYAQNMGGGTYKSNLPDNLEIIKAVGYEHVMVDTDGGQTENPHWELALEEYMQYLVDHGIPEETGCLHDKNHSIPASWDRRVKGGEENVKCSHHVSDCLAIFLRVQNED